MSLLKYNKNKISYLLAVVCLFVCAQALSQSGNKNQKKDNTTSSLENKKKRINDEINTFLFIF